MVMPLDQLLSGYARDRYDDEGNPLYTPAEQILMKLRWLGWATWARIREALELEYLTRDMTGKYNAALARLVREKRLDVRMSRYSSEREYRVAAVQPKWKQPKPDRECDEDGKPLRKDHKRAMQKVSARRRRRDDGLCLGCGGERDSEFLNCSSCRAKDWANYQRRKAQKKCSRCKASAAPGKTMCVTHVAEAKAKRHEQYERNKELGVCDVCRKPSKTVVCAACCEERNARRAA